MAFNFEKLQTHCADVGFDFDRTSPDSLTVSISASRLLTFANLIEESDTLIGFEGTPWHTHGSVSLLVSAARYVDMDEYDTLTAIRIGDVVIAERFMNGELVDRWLAHKLEPFDLKYIEPSEELPIYRLPELRVG